MKTTLFFVLRYTIQCQLFPQSALSTVTKSVTKSSVELGAPELQKGSMRVKEKECISYIVVDVNTRNAKSR